MLSIVWNNCKWVFVSTDDWVLTTADVVAGWFIAVNNVAMRSKLLIWDFLIQWIFYK